MRGLGDSYTKGSLTDTTKMSPAFVNLGELMYPGTWDSEHDGPTCIDQDPWMRIWGAGTGNAIQASQDFHDLYVLNAAGTPTMRPLPRRAFERLTLLPGEPSMSSTSGMGSPTSTASLAEEWKRREAERTPLGRQTLRATYMLKSRNRGRLRLNYCARVSGR